MLFPDAPILGQVALSYCPIIDRHRNVMATRLTVFPLGQARWLPVGELQKQLVIPASTPSHHIAALVSVGLVKQNRESRTLLCVSQYAVLEEIIAFFRDECCINSPEHRQDQRQGRPS